MTDSDAWKGYEPPTPQIGDNVKSVLEGQVKDLLAAEHEIVDLEVKLAEAKAKFTRLAEQVIPATMEDMGQTKASLVSGVTVEVTRKVFASPPKAKREDMYDWLERNGHGGLIKRQGIFTVGRDNEAKAKRWIKSIKSFPGRFERKVEPQTLRAFVSNALDEGLEIPMETFGAYTKRIAVVKSDT